jgi:lipopolysaccharide export system permease protein
MQRLQKYILTQITVAAAMTITGLTLAIWLSQSLRLLDVIVNRGLSVGMALEFLMFLLPGLIALLLPVAVFISIMFVYYRLNADSELVVMRGAGVSNFGLAGPALTFGLATMAISYGLSLYAVPESMRDFRDFEQNMEGNLAGILIEDGVFTDLAPGVTFYVHRRDRNGGLSGIIVDDSRDPSRRVIYTAARGSILGGAAGPHAVLYNGTYQETDGKSGGVSVLYFGQTEVALAGGYGRSTAGPRQRSIEELYLGDLLSAKRGTDPLMHQRMVAEAHRRLADPLYSLAMALVAVASLITSNLPRQSQHKQMLMATAGAGALMMISVVLRSMTHRIPALGPLVYVVPAVAIVICGCLLVRPKGMQPTNAALARGITKL